MTLRRPSPALLLAAAALFAALGGPAAAEDAFTSAKKKITGNRIAKNAITSPKIRNGAIKAVDLGAGVLPDAYSKLESDARFQPAGSYLAAAGKAADADRIDGLDGSDLMTGSVRHGATTVAGNAPAATLLSLPGLIDVLATCPANAPRLTLDYLGDIRQVHIHGNSNVADSVAGLANVTADTMSGFLGGESHLEVNTVRYGATGPEIHELSLWAQDEGDDCSFSAFAFARSG